MNNLENIKKKITPILKKYGIKKAGIFGSSIRGESVVNDLDLLVKIDKKISLLKFIGIQQELEDIRNNHTNDVKNGLNCQIIKFLQVD